MTSARRPEPPRILSVGQCGFDHRAISRFLEKQFDAEVEPADTPEEAVAALGHKQYHLVLVNRVLDMDGSSGLELIRTLKSDPKLAFASLPVMLISDFPEAQRSAQELGAVPGFGKSELGGAPSIDRLKHLLG